MTMLDGTIKRTTVHTRSESKHQPRAANELSSIQVLRALAATSVIVYHLDLFHRGGYGVDIFFVISGFIAAFICSKNADQFLAKRMIRIVPLYWLGTLGVFTVALLAPSILNSTTADLGELLKSMLFLPFERSNGKISPVLFLGWSLQYEVLFYVIFGISLKISRKSAGAISSAILVFIAFAGQWIPESSTALSFFSHPIIVEFAFGIAIFAIWKNYKLLLAKIPVVLAAIVAFVSYALLFVETDKVSRADRLALVGIPSALIVLSFLAFEGRVRFPRWLLLVGDASFSLYLFHPYVLQLVDKKIVSLATLTPTAIVAAIVSIVACFGLAIVSFRLIEKPTNTWLRRVLIPARVDVRRVQSDQSNRSANEFENPVLITAG
jgi:exopolysaccharide production protein ExoZ